MSIESDQVEWVPGHWGQDRRHLGKHQNITTEIAGVCTLEVSASLFLTITTEPWGPTLLAHQQDNEKRK